MTEDLKTERLSYSVEEAAELVGVCKATLYNRMREGKLAAFKLGSRTLIKRAELVRYIDSLSKAA